MALYVEGCCGQCAGFAYKPLYVLLFVQSDLHLGQLVDQSKNYSSVQMLCNYFSYLILTYATCKALQSPIDRYCGILAVIRLQLDDDIRPNI